MAYVPTTCVDRSVEFPNRRKLTAVSGQADTFDVARAEGSVFAEGTKLDAANLNAEFGKIKTETDDISNSFVKIVVSCRNDSVGKTVTCTNGDKNCSEVVGINLAVVFNVGVTGNWTVSCDNSSKVINANYYGLYNVNFQFVTYGVDIDFSMTNPSSMCTYTDDAVGMVAG